jgi:hypothetical protein
MKLPVVQCLGESGALPRMVAVLLYCRQGGMQLTSMQTMVCTTGSMGQTMSSQ